MASNRHVIIFPGLGNGIRSLVWATKGWERFGITPHIFDVRWTVEEPRLQPKLDRALKLVDELYVSGKRISLVGNSAGSSFALNVFAARKNKIHKVIVNCGRVRRGDWPWFTFDQATATSASFKTSVSDAEKVITSLSKKERKKILTLRPLFDEVVPPTTVPIDGASNEVILSIGHVLSIGFNLTLYKHKIMNFIRTLD